MKLVFFASAIFFVPAMNKGRRWYNKLLPVIMQSQYLLHPAKQRKTGVAIKVVRLHKYHFSKCKRIPSFAKKKQALRHLGTILLLLAFLTQTFSKSFIVAGYYANTAAYAKNCENKARPKLHCNGRCQMMKKLKQEENKDKQNPERKSDNKEEVISYHSFCTTIHFSSVEIKTIYPQAGTDKAIDMPHSFFHPPGA